MDSDAVFHEESEYVMDFEIPETYDELSLIFRKKCFFAKRKKAKKRI
jgi:hypothetical protein